MAYEFTPEQWLVLIRLIIAHLITDFVFQPGEWVKDKQDKKYRSAKLYMHGAFTGLVAYLLIPGWGWLTIVLALAITVIHTMTDIWKSYTDNGRSDFYILDQVLHLITLIIIWLIYISGWQAALEFWLALLRNNTALLVFIGYLLCLWPAGYTIDLVLKEMHLPPTANAAASEGISRGGMRVGFFERVIILTLVLLGQYAVVGFFLIGKSLLRWGEKQKGTSEYILMGTMLSYAIAIVIGVVLRMLVF